MRSFIIDAPIRECAEPPAEGGTFTDPSPRFPAGRARLRLRAGYSRYEVFAAGAKSPALGAPFLDPPILWQFGPGCSKFPGGCYRRISSTRRSWESLVTIRG